MNKRKIETTLTEAGLPAESFNVVTAGRVIVQATDRDGDLDFDETERASARAMDALGWGGFRTGSGAWHIVKRRPFRPSGNLEGLADPVHY